MGATQRDGIALDRIKLLTEIEGSDLCFSVVYPSFEGTLETFKLSIDFSTESNNLVSVPRIIICSLLSLAFLSSRRLCLSIGSNLSALRQEVTSSKIPTPC